MNLQNFQIFSQGKEPHLIKFFVVLETQEIQRKAKEISSIVDYSSSSLRLASALHFRLEFLNSEKVKVNFFGAFEPSREKEIVQHSRAEQSRE